MSELTLALLLVFASVALLAGLATSAVLNRGQVVRRRLFGSEPGGAGDQTGVLAASGPLVAEVQSDRQKRLARLVPKSRTEMGRLRRRLATAGFHGFTPVLVYSVAEIVCPLLAFALVYLVLDVELRWLFGLMAAAAGYLVPAYIVQRRLRLRQKEIRNGLPDALDLLIVTLEAGLALDQAMLKCSEDLAIAYPALAEEFRLINIETRAGKPRLEALKNFAARTQVDDVRALVAMLVQTDRFGTSVAQSLRTHAEESRIKRRQRAEEKAAKLSVKLIFPLVFFLLPAFFVVATGPALIEFVEFFGNLDV
jgi:tight adherence protein C